MKSPRERDVFINTPFDVAGEQIFLALICGLISLGLNPRSVLEIPPDRSRLQRLHQLIAQCGYSVHDLSRVTSTRSGVFRVPRLNMAFELGMAVAIALSTDRHRWRVLERVPHRLGVSLSDLGGYEIAIHHGRIDGVFQALLDMIIVHDAPVPDERGMMRVYRQVKRVRDGLGPNIFRPDSFRKLVLAARLVVRQMGAPDAAAGGARGRF